MVGGRCQEYSCFVCTINKLSLCLPYVCLKKRKDPLPELQINNFPCQCSYHCAIEDGDAVVLTGGKGKLETDWSTMRKVTRYNMQGQATTLPSLKSARTSHACGTIKKSDGATVIGSD